jgi:hypothetical protein
MANFTKIRHDFYGYQLTQNASNTKLSLYVGAMDAQILRDVVSVDNAVKWDASSAVWKSGGRNRTIEEAHWRSIQEFLSSSNQERILPSAIVISVDNDAFEFKPFQAMQPIARVTPGILTIVGRYNSRSDGQQEPCAEPDRPAWVLDGQHRTMAFRHWSMPDPYPVNVIILKRWAGGDYEDVMRHQTYELNMGRPLSDDFKAAIREQYDRQLGHKEYKRQIALSWIRKDLEQRGRVFSSEGIVGATNLRTPYVITMSFLEKLIGLAYETDPALKNNYLLEKLDKEEVGKIGKYLYDFFEGVRLSIGLINPGVKGTIGTEPAVEAANDYWDIATTTQHKQRLLHNVGLKAVVKGLLPQVMGSDKPPQTPGDVAYALRHMRGIPWHNAALQSKKDDWTTPLAEALSEMFRSKGTAGKNKKYQLLLLKKDPKTKDVIDQFTLEAHGFVRPGD